LYFFKKSTSEHNSENAALRAKGFRNDTTGLGTKAVINLQQGLGVKKTSRTNVASIGSTTGVKFFLYVGNKSK
jgi:hypothetical protein